jgi:hypothetical protein
VLDRRLIAAALLAALATSAPAATLDVAASGDDLVFTWDAGADDLLRGTTPDNLLPWLPAVTSPLLVPGENAIRGENAFYRLASGSNMGMRVERTFTVADPERPWAVPTTLPQRRTLVTALDLFARWPTLTEVVWMGNGSPHGASRVGGRTIGELGTLPSHRGVWLAFSTTTTVTLVGSHDDADPGLTVDELLAYGYVGVLPIPADSLAASAAEILCGERGVDWFDADADGLPDACGRDLDADGRPDTGLWAIGPMRPADCYSVNLSREDSSGWTGESFSVLTNPIVGGETFRGTDFAFDRGDALVLSSCSDGTAMNLPFVVTTW